MSLFRKSLFRFSLVLSFLVFPFSLLSEEILITFEVDGWDISQEVKSLSWGMKNEATDHLEPPEPADFDNVALVSLLDSESPQRFLNTAWGHGGGTAFFRFYESGEDNPFFEIEIDYITFAEAGIEASDEEVLQLLSLRYNRIRWTYYTYDSEGEVDETFQEGWDLIDNSPW
ncbi:MAG: type VI secretion system tube protein Hcp [Opitutales bacterium]|nr:type VI secretion system tube protein Hcp [Opitutales bacterium]MCH8541510.1 type VI secretion system tube protein Hcp [Opitutales bacterium]